MLDDNRIRRIGNPVCLEVDDMTVKEEIMLAVQNFPGMTDTDLEKRTKHSHQTINIACRQLVKEGILVRRPNPDKNGYLGNYPTGKPLEISNSTANSAPVHTTMNEDAVKAHIKNRLEADGWNVKVAWGYVHGVDVEASRKGERWLIEVKGPGSRPEMRVNYFIAILGETLQRMDDPNAHYSIAFPDMQVFRSLWAKLPPLAKRRTGIDLILVDEAGTLTMLK
jgi:hypothetical protein